MANKRITDVDFLESLNSDESFFVNQNNSIKQISKSNIIFDVISGGTGANNASDARVNLGAAAIEHNHDASDVGAVPSAGGTMTGTLVMDGGDIVLKEGVNYGTEEQMPAAGVKGRVFLKKIKTSS